MFEYNDNTESLGELCHPPHPVSFIPFAPSAIQGAKPFSMAWDELNFLMHSPVTLRLLAKRLRDAVEKYNGVQWGMSIYQTMSPEAALAMADHYDWVAGQIESKGFHYNLC